MGGSEGERPRLRVHLRQADARGLRAHEARRARRRQHRADVQVGLANQLLGQAVKVERPAVSAHRQPRQARAPTRSHIATPTVYIVNNPVLNAATYGTNEDSFIMVHSALIDHYSDEELLTVIGHECGHIHNSHVVVPHRAPLPDAHGQRLRGWVVAAGARRAAARGARRAEITCDRAGMLCAKDTRGRRSRRSRSSRSVRGSSTRSSTSRRSSSSTRRGKDGIGKYMEVFASHPWLPKRVLAMRVFAKSEHLPQGRRLGLDGGLTDDRGRCSRRARSSRVTRDARSVPRAESSRSRARWTSWPRSPRDAGRQERSASASTRDLVHKLAGGPLPPRRRGRVQPRQVDVRERAARRERRSPRASRRPRPRIHHLKWAASPRRRSSTRPGERETTRLRATREAFAVGGGSAGARTSTSSRSATPPPLLEGAHPARRHARRERPVAPARGHHLQLHPARRRGPLPARRGADPEGERAGLPAGEAPQGVARQDRLRHHEVGPPEPDEQAEALAYARDQLAKLVKDPDRLPRERGDARSRASVAESGMPRSARRISRAFSPRSGGASCSTMRSAKGSPSARSLRRASTRERRSIAMKSDELERRIALLEKDLAGQAGTIEQRRSQIREEVSGIRVGARKDLDRFVDDVIRQLPHVIDVGEGRRAQAVPARVPGGHVPRRGPRPRRRRSPRRSRASPRRRSRSSATTRTTRPSVSPRRSAPT